MAAMFLLLWPLGARPSWPMLALPLALGLFGIFTLGLSLIVATANTFYRDCGHLISVFLQAWYFLTPILYPIDGKTFSERAQWLLRLNPAFYFIELFHDILSRGQWPRLELVAASALIAAVTLGVGYAIFKSQEDKMVFRL
jgi:ABC-2 type transport system permease protein/lipopolysaccharide transport system permease protein